MSVFIVLFTSYSKLFLNFAQRIALILLRIFKTEKDFCTLIHLTIRRNKVVFANQKHSLIKSNTYKNNIVL